MTQVTPLQDGFILITGASSGIGLACIEAVLNNNLKPIAAVRSQSSKEKLINQFGCNLDFIDLDLSEAQSILNAVELIGEYLADQPLWGIVNSAGVNLPGPVECIPIERMKQQFQVNLFGTIELIRHSIKYLRKGPGRIINIGSKLGRISAPLLAPYCGSKAALAAISGSLRMELKPWDIHVSVVEPGAVKTNIWETTKKEGLQFWESLPESQRIHYEKKVRATIANADKIADSGIEASEVAKKVIHGLTSPSPKYWYISGKDTWIALFLSKLLPIEIMDRMILSSR